MLLPPGREDVLPELTDRSPHATLEGTHGEPCPTLQLAAELFARFAEENVDLWRRLVGCRVEPIHPDWGLGVIEHVSWGSRLDHVAPYVQIDTSYEAIGRIRIHAITWSLHHQVVEVPPNVYQAVTDCLDPQLSEEERSARVLQHSRRWREQYDREALRRAASMERQISSDSCMCG
jgi:hypothetical protein